MRWILACALLMVGCTEKNKYESLKYEKSEESGVVFDLVFPKAFWDLIIKQSPPTIKSDTSVYDLLEALPIDVKIVEGEAGILRRKNYWITFNEFGGRIDFSQYLHPEVKGDFRLLFEPESGTEEDPVQLKKVYFLSWTPQSNQNDEVFGGGCNALYDVTSYFEKTVSKDGLLLHTAQNRYFYLTAGRLYFVYYMKNKIRIAQVTLTDQRLESNLCENRL